MAPGFLLYSFLFRMNIDNVPNAYFSCFYVFFDYLCKTITPKLKTMKTQTFATLPDGTRVFVLDIINSFTTNIGSYPESAKVKRPLYNMNGKYIGDSIFYVETSKLKY